MTVKTRTTTARKIARGKTTPASTAGSFTTYAHGVADIDLGAEPHTEPDADYGDLGSGVGMALDETAAYHARLESIASARHYIRSYNMTQRQGSIVDEDDIAQEILILRLKAEREGKQVGKGYAHRSARSIVSQAASSVKRYEDRAALARYGERCLTAEATLGRTLTNVEQDRIAADIREGWHDQRHKPTEGFHRRVYGEVRLDATFEADDGSHRLDFGEFLAKTTKTTISQGSDPTASEVIEGAASRYGTAGEYTERAVAAVEAGGVETNVARRVLWNAMAEMSSTAGNPIPAVEEGILTQHVVSCHQAAMNNQEGGVLAAAKAWGEGHDSAATEALFAPWPNTTNAERTAIIEHLERHRDYAEEMWHSALQLANLRLALRDFQREESKRTPPQG
jgi:hypothetical protein